MQGTVEISEAMAGATGRERVAVAGPPDVLSRVVVDVARLTGWLLQQEVAAAGPLWPRLVSDPDEDPEGAEG